MYEDIKIEEQINIPMLYDIKNSSASYIGDGNLKMDKKQNRYCKDQQELVIESVFIHDISVGEIVKTYLLDICKHRWYNQTNMIAAAQKEEKE